MTKLYDETAGSHLTLPPEIAELLQGKEKDEHTLRAEKWVKSMGIKRRIEMYAKNTDINRPKKKLTYDIAAGGRSYTDGKHVRLALPERWFEKRDQDYVRFMKFVTAHELGHINWSDFVLFVDFQKRVEKHFNTKHGIQGAGRFAGELLNITEDGRIERAQVNVMPGLLKYVRYVNGTNYEAMEANQLGIVPLHDFRNVSLALSKTGLLPKGYDKRVEGTNTDVAIKIAMPHIVRAIRAETAKECADATWDMIMDNEEFLVDAMKEFEIDEDQLKDMLEEDLSEDEGQEGSGGFGPSMEMDGDGEGDSGDGEGSDESGDEGDGNGSGKNNKESEGEGKGGKDGSGDESKDSSTGEGSEKEGKEKGKGKGKKITIKPLGGMDGKPDFENRPSQTKAPQGAQSAHFGDEEKMAEGEADASSLVKGEGEGLNLEELIVDTEDESNDFLDKAKEIAKRENKRLACEKAERQETEVGKEEVNGVLSKYARGMDFRYTAEITADNGSIPDILNRRGRGLRRDLKEIFNDKRGWTLMNQRSGMLDENQLYRAGSGLQQSDIFIKKQMPEDTNWVVSVLVDNSGSMSGSVSDSSGERLGSKTKVAREATTVLEIALNGLVPFKISRFDVAWNNGRAVQHANVRGWEQKTKSILSWNSTDRAGGGNADAMSIGVAVEELKKRPEQKKMLIVMSDGLPAENTPQQVKHAVEQARKDGVKVVAIGFGPEYELENNAKTYHEMYGDDIVLTMPDGLTKELVKIMRQTILRGG